MENKTKNLEDGYFGSKMEKNDYINKCGMKISIKVS